MLNAVAALAAALLCTLPITVAGSAGSCYDPITHDVTCDVAETECTFLRGYYYAPGYVGHSGCCHCSASCDHTDEVEHGCIYYDVPTSQGSCYNSTGMHDVTCNVAETECNSRRGHYYASGFVGHSGCCHCSASCDHTAEIGSEDCVYYDDLAMNLQPEESVQGSCYHLTTHTVACNVAEAECNGHLDYYYAPGYVGHTGCCHCSAACDHSDETATDCTYYDVVAMVHSAPAPAFNKYWKKLTQGFGTILKLPRNPVSSTTVQTHKITSEKL